MTIENTVQAIEARLGSQLRRIDSLPDEIAYECDAAQWIEVSRVLRDDPTLRFEMLIDLAGVDYSEFGKSEWKTLSATGSGFRAALIAALRHKSVRAGGALQWWCSCCRSRTTSVCVCAPSVPTTRNR